MSARAVEEARKRPRNALLGCIWLADGRYVTNTVTFAINPAELCVTTSSHPHELQIFVLTVYAYACTGRIPEALRNLQSCAQTNETTLAATLAMIHAHKQSKLVDRDALASLEVSVSLVFESVWHRMFHFVVRIARIQLNFSPRICHAQTRQTPRTRSRRAVKLRCILPRRTTGTQTATRRVVILLTSF